MGTVFIAACVQALSVDGQYGIIARQCWPRGIVGRWIHVGSVGFKITIDDTAFADFFRGALVGGLASSGTRQIVFMPGETETVSGVRQAQTKQ